MEQLQRHTRHMLAHECVRHNLRAAAESQTPQAHTSARLVAKLFFASQEARRRRATPPPQLAPFRPLRQAHFLQCVREWRDGFGRILLHSLQLVRGRLLSQKGREELEVQKFDQPEKHARNGADFFSNLEQMGSSLDQRKSQAKQRVQHMPRGRRGLRAGSARLQVRVVLANGTREMLKLCLDAQSGRRVRFWPI